jgi:hypothetical protein
MSRESWRPMVTAGYSLAMSSVPCRARRSTENVLMPLDEPVMCSSAIRSWFTVRPGHIGARGLRVLAQPEIAHQPPFTLRDKVGVCAVERVILDGLA